MKYNITFRLGDPGNDGHCIIEEYHITANHSVEDITEAYNKTTEVLGFDFIEKIGKDYDSNFWIPVEYTKKLLEFGIITDEYVTKEDETERYGPPEGCYEFDDATLEFIDIFFSIVKYSLPDFSWKSRELNEDRLYILEGKAYGFV